MSKWVRIDAVLTERLPSSPGCYVVYLDGRLTYVGQTNNLRKRLTEHGCEYARYSHATLTPWGRCIDAHVKYRRGEKLGEWLMREYRLIHRLQPAGNRMGVRKQSTCEEAA